MQFDVLLAGGGLANLLIAERLASLRPECSFVVVEAAAEVGGNHTWSFHGSDLLPATRRWVEPLAPVSWSGYDVRFPGLERTIDGTYHSVSSGVLAARLRARFGERLRTGTSIRNLRSDGATLDDGSEIRAGLVLDGRGWDPAVAVSNGFQKFLGREVRLARPHGLTRPIIMDATVAQDGGYRFVYVLPLTPDTLLVEDTVYGDTPSLDRTAAASAIDRYLADRGWMAESVLREEQGALPIPLAGSFAALETAFLPGVPAVGVRAGLFHATTGYSLPFAARTAEMVAGLPAFTPAAADEVLRRYARQSWEGQRFFRLLNRMLFVAARPEERYRVLERFYRLKEGLISRFYAARLTPLDKMRLLTGRPPVPMLSALAVLPDRPPAATR